jgi:hypothetical protein
MNIITFETLKKFIDREARVTCNVDLFWGLQEVIVYPTKFERVSFRLFRNLRRNSTKFKPHKRDNGHTVYMSDVPKIVRHFQKLKIFPLGAIKVIP